jgi:hypothetical protein
VPALFVSIQHPTQNENVDLSQPYRCDGTMSKSITSMAYQIDGGTLNFFSTFNSAAGTWYFDLTSSDCPTVGDSYTLTVHGYTSETSTESSVDFTRSA